MRNLVYILTLIILSGCSSIKKEVSTFEGNTYSWININLTYSPDIDFEYGVYEFLKNGRLISEDKISSEVVLQQGNWNYFRQDNKEYLVLETLDQLCTSPLNSWTKN